MKRINDIEYQALEKLFENIEFINCKDRQPTEWQHYYAILYDETDKENPFYFGVAEFYNGEWYENKKVIAWLDIEETRCIG